MSYQTKFNLYALLVIVLIFSLIGLSGCANQPKEPCHSLECMKDDARKEQAELLYKACVAQNHRPRSNPWKIVYNANMQHPFQWCRPWANEVARKQVR